MLQYSHTGGAAPEKEGTSMKRFFCALLACCLTLTAGCGGASSVSSAATGAAGAQAPASGQLVEQGAGFVFGGSGLTGQTPSGGSTLVAEPLEEGAAAPAPGQFMALESYGAGLEVEKENRSPRTSMTGALTSGRSPLLMVFCITVISLVRRVMSELVSYLSMLENAKA